MGEEGARPDAGLRLEAALSLVSPPSAASSPRSSSSFLAAEEEYIQDDEGCDAPLPRPAVALPPVPPAPPEDPGPGGLLPRSDGWRMALK